MKKLINSGSRLLISAVFLIAMLSISNSCSEPMYDMGGDKGGNGNPGGPGTNEVFIQNHAFNPSTITVTAGTSIKWTNKDSAVHTVTSDDGVFNSPSLSTNGIFSFTFPVAGTYKYHCTPHPDMTATVIVN